MAWSRGWCAHIRPEESIKRLTTDPHSPNYFRVNGVVGNIPEFYKQGEMYRIRTILAQF